MASTITLLFSLTLSSYQSRTVKERIVVVVVVVVVISDGVDDGSVCVCVCFGTGCACFSKDRREFREADELEDLFLVSRKFIK